MRAGPVEDDCFRSPEPRTTKPVFGSWARSDPTTWTFVKIWWGLLRGLSLSPRASMTWIGCKNRTNSETVEGGCAGLAA